MKKTLLGLLSVSALALLFSVTPAMAASVDVTAENHRTGSDSDNENTYDIDHDIDLDVDNDSDVDNDADADVNTGHNDQEDNTTAGDLETGAIDASTDWETVLGTGAALANADDGLDVTADFANDTTGSDSDNENDLALDHDVDIDVDNMVDVMNDLDLYANTGHNDQEDNTIAGDLETGDIDVDSAVSNRIGSNNDLLSVMPSTSVDLTGENRITGSDSDNKNRFDIDNDFDLDVDNDVDIDNKFDVKANTGHNEQRDNTIAGDINTGDIDVSTDVENVVGTGVALTTFPGLDVNVDASNDTTGSDSDNTNDVDIDNDVDVDVNNDVNIDNDLDVYANTGHNEQKDNTEGGDISTGDVQVEFNVSNRVN